MDLTLLIQSCINNDRKAQKELYMRYATKMFRIVYRYVQEEQEAEDILQIGFLKVFKNLSKLDYRGEKSLEAWIKRILINECLMLLRKRKQFFVDADNAYSLKEDAKAIQNLNLEDLYQMIRMMPEGYRTVFNLYVIEGYSHKEIAEQLEVNVNTSKSQLSKGKKWLRNLLEKKGIVYEF